MVARGHAEYSYLGGRDRGALELLLLEDLDGFSLKFGILVRTDGSSPRGRNVWL